MNTNGIIVRVSGPTVVAENMVGTRMFNRVRVGELGLPGEVIRLERDRATIQVYEETAGLRQGEKVSDTGEPLLAELGPGLLASAFDGIQRPLEMIRRQKGDFMERGISIAPLSREKVWEYRSMVKVGDQVQPGDILGIVPETPYMQHRVMVPPGYQGKIGSVQTGEVTVTEPIAVLEDGRALTLLQKWAVRTPRPFLKRMAPTHPFITGQRVFDILFPLAMGGTAIAPGGFGTGKTVVKQGLAKYAESDIIIFVGCGERGNEMTEVLTDFPTLVDPATGRPLFERTVLIVNTSNMPVAAREASIYTGITVAEYYRDMGYRVAMMSDSLSRWAEALREVASRLEEMPGEEGYPTYLATRLAGFYERGGRVVCLGKEGREGTITLVSAISPPGGDFSEPVTQSSQRVAGVLWALDADLAHRRHFPAINWKKSYSLYTDVLDNWFRENVADNWPELRRELVDLLQREEELQELVQLVGIDALQDPERLLLMMSRLIREDFLRQSAFSKDDAFCPLEKGYRMLKVFLAFHRLCQELLLRGIPIDKILGLSLWVELERMKEVPAQDIRQTAEALITKINKESRAE